MCACAGERASKSEATLVAQEKQVGLQVQQRLVEAERAHTAQLHTEVKRSQASVLP